MKISQRLQEVAKFAVPFSSLIDIGSDHGLLPIYLKKRYPLSKIGATEAKPAPFSRLKLAAEQADVVIDLYQTNGLQKLPAAAVIAICGMGGNLISKIISETPYLAQFSPRLILEPQSDFYRVRQTLSEQGYRINREKYIFEKHHYPIIEAIPGAEGPLTDAEMKYGKRALDSRDPELFILLKKEFILCRQNAKLSGQSESLAAIIRKYYDPDFCR